ncbi:MAG TPA: hypothetical protein VG225_00145 [Terracidiphilus sp.]|jgi:hypothetical protein|nr:hypothetical protein [Terracidiphilus sp.]
MSTDEERLRAQFDFSKIERGKYYERYKKGHTITLLPGGEDSDDPLDPTERDSQLTEIAGKHLLISRLVAAGFEVAEPLRDKGIDLIVYRGDDKFTAWPIQMKSSTQESFSLDRKYKKIPNLLMAYVWNVNTVKQGEVYLLTFNDAEKVMKAKGFAKTNSWTKNGYYFRRNADPELKGLLKQYGMTADQWRQKIHITG